MPDVMLRVPHTLSDSDIDKLLAPYNPSDIRIHDFTMYAGRWRIVACTVSGSALFRLGRSEPLVDDCQENHLVYPDLLDG